MDLLQRIQRWYTINCNGDWEHSYGISITTLDNPGWTVKIGLQDTCLRNAALQYSLVERSTTNWIGCSVKNGEFEGIGGPENLSEILEYFLDTFLPSNLESSCTIDIGLPVCGYEGQLWVFAEGKMISESVLEIVNITDLNSMTSYLWANDKSMEILSELRKKLSELKTDFKVGDHVAPSVFQSEDNMLNTFLVARAKKWF